MFCIGLTGSIGSGKSSALGFFKSLQVPVISADQISRALTEKDGKAYPEILAHFGSQVVDSQGGLKRSLIRTIIFEDKTERLWLESLLHPLIRIEILEQLQQSKGPYCVIEIPLLLNRDDWPYLNRILVIQADPPIQIQRIMARDHCTAESAKKILNTQMSSEALRQLADDILLNNGTVEDLEKHIVSLHNRYLVAGAKFMPTSRGLSAGSRGSK